MVRHRRALASALAAAALLVPLAAGCGEEASAAEVVAASADATVEATTARVSMVMDMSGMPGMDGDLSLEGEGETDFESGRAAMRMDMSALLEQAGAPGGLDGTIETLVDGNFMYMRGGMFTQGIDLPEGTWLKADLQEFADAQGIDLAQAQQAGTNDPRQQLAMLKGVSEDGVEELGEEEVRGARTTHYRAEVDLERALEESGAVIDREDFERYVDSLPFDSTTVDLWIDGDDRVRRMVMEMPVPEGGNATIAMTMEFYDFGAELDLEPPRAEDTRDFNELMQRAQAQGARAAEEG